MTFAIKSITGEVLYTSDRSSLRGALEEAVQAGADLRGAYLHSADLSHANLHGAVLRGTYLAGADLSGADLSGAVGNMWEVKSAFFDCWPVVWTQPPDDEPILQIGCQSQPLSMWEKSDPRWIAAMDPSATEWWARYREPLLALVKASPAVPFGSVDVK